MTIKIEREALLRVLSREPSGSLSSCDSILISDDGEFVLVDIPKPLLGEDFYAKSLRDPTSDDENSLCTFSTDSFSSDSSASIEKRVSFATTLVTAEWTRPWTPREDVPNLFYSTEETVRFRQEYRLERKALTELSIDVDNHDLDNEELSNLIATSTHSLSSRHRISRVVVMHNDRFETFVNPDGNLSMPKGPVSGTDFFDNDSFWSGSLTWY